MRGLSAFFIKIFPSEDKIYQLDLMEHTYPCVFLRSGDEKRVKIDFLIF